MYVFMHIMYINIILYIQYMYVTISEKKAKNLTKEPGGLYGGIKRRKEKV